METDNILWKNFLPKYLIFTMLKKIFKLRPAIVEEKLGAQIHLGSPWIILLLPLTFVIMYVQL